MDNAADIVIAGAGLSAHLVALRLAGQARVLMIDQRPDPLAGHTWSFHHADIPDESRAWLAPAIRREWAGQEVRFPCHARRLGSGYASLDAESLGAAVAALPGVTVMQGYVREMDGRSLTLEDGRRIEAPLAIDARGFRPHRAAEVRFQKFLGQEIELEQPHSLIRPVIMDATVPQNDGYRFFYLLPFDDRRLLIEDTYCSDAWPYRPRSSARPSPITPPPTAGRWPASCVRNGASCPSRCVLMPRPSGRAVRRGSPRLALRPCGSIR